MPEQILQRRQPVSAMASPMSGFATVVCKLDLVLKKISAWSIVLLVAAMVIAIWISVFTRYVMGDAVAWGEQIAKYLMIWAAMIGSSLAVREGAHIAVTLLVDRLPFAFARILAVVAFSGSAVFLAVATYYGTTWAASASVQTDPAVWNMALSIPYSAIPVGSALMLVQLFLRLVEFLEHDGSDY